jgi:hypothetical protein
MWVNGEKQGTVGFSTEEDLIIDGIWPNRLLKVRRLRVAREALHLNRDRSLALVRGLSLFRPEIDILIRLSPPDVEQAVGDRPSIRDQGVFELVVIPISHGHRDTPFGVYSEKTGRH